MTTRSYRYYENWSAEPELRKFMDSNDPYKLIREAKEARALLDEKFVKGHEFLGIDEHGDEFGIRAFDDPNVKYLCSIGAVFYVQGHQAFECNLITALNKNSGILHPETTTCDDEDCDCNSRGSIVSVNDDFGKDSALAVFDYTIAEYQAEIDLAEAWDAEYKNQRPRRNSIMRGYTSTFDASKPIIGAATQPVSKEVNVPLHVS